MRASRTVPHDGLVLEEEGSGPALYCLHGLGGGAHWFRGLSRRLKVRFRVATLDLPGTGANREACAPFSMDRCAEALARHLEDNEPAPVSLLGHSLGTILALRVQALVPGRIRSLIFVGGLPAVTPATRMRLSARRDAILRGGMAGLGWGVAEGIFSKAFIRHNPEFIAFFARQWESQSAQAYVEGIEALISASAWHLPSGARVPGLVLAGGEDRYAPPAETTRFVEALAGPVRRVELRACGHMPFLEAPLRFQRALSEFMVSAAALGPQAQLQTQL